MTYFLEPYTRCKIKIKFELDLSNYVTKSDLKNTTGVNTSDFAKKIGLTSLKTTADKLDVDELHNASSGLSNLKSKLDKLDVDKLVPVPVNLSMLIDLVKIDFVKKNEYDELVKKINATDTNGFVKKNRL